MVSRHLRIGLLGALIALGSPAPTGRARQEGPPPGPDPEAVAAVREAFRGRQFPWYDAEGDAFRPLMPPRTRAPQATGPGRGWGWNLAEISLRELGQLIVFVLLAASLTALILFIARTWQRRLGVEEQERATRPGRVTGTTARVGTLPTGLEVDESDPLDAARRLRDRGDLRRAVVLLFAHQLLTLDRLGLIRLAPGRTGRQLVRSIGEPAIRGPLSRSLRLFEDVYYGHREPDPDAFEALWAEAEALERRLAAGVSP